MNLSRKTLALIIGHRLRSKRMDLGLSQSQVAKAICSQAGISMFENGMDLPAPETLKLLAERLEDDLLKSYVESIRGDLNDYSISEDDSLLLLDAFKGQKSRITSEQFSVALSLIDTLYSKTMLREVLYLTKRIVDQYYRTHADLDSVYYRSCFYYGSCLLFQFQFDQAIEWLKISYQGIAQCDSLLQARICYNLGYGYYCTNAFGKALWYTHKAEHLFKERNQYPNQGKALVLIGAVLGQLGMREESVESLHAGISLLEKWGANELDIVLSYSSLADQYLALKQAHTAVKYCERIMQSPDILDTHPVIRSSVERILSITAYLSSDIHRALHHFSRAQDAAQQSGDQWTIARTALLGIMVLPDEDAKIQMAELIIDSDLNLSTCIEHGLAYKYLVKLAKRNKKPHRVIKYLELLMASYEMNIKSYTDISVYAESID